MPSALRRSLISTAAALGTAAAVVLPAQQALAAVPLTIDAGPDATVAEGSAFTRSMAIIDEVDDGTPGWTYQVSYGDGTLGSEQTTLTPSITLDHTFANGTATRTVMVSVWDTAAEGMVDSFVVNVANVAPTGTLQGPVAVSEGSAHQWQVVATDPGADSLTYFLRWADGLQAQWFIPVGTGIAPHLYRDDADGPDNATTHNLELTVNDGEASSPTLVYPVVVNNVPPVIPLSGAASATVGAAYTLTLGAITDPGTDTVTSGVIRWGDGTSQPLTVNGAQTHIYATSGTKTIAVELTDEDGTFVGGTLAVDVAASTPSAPSGLTATALSRSSIRLNWTNTTANQTSVYIERCKGVGCTSFSRIATVSGTAVTYTNTGLSSRTTYTYRIRSANAAGTSPYSAKVAARTL